MGVQKIGWEPTEKLRRKLRGYRGRWVAIVGEDVVLSDDDRAALGDAIRARGIAWDSIEYVPTGEEPPLIL